MPLHVVVSRRNKVLCIFFIFFSLALTFFHSFDMIALALETGTPWNSFLVFQISLQNRLYAVFFDGTLGFNVFKGFTLKTLGTLSSFWMKLSLSSFTPVNSKWVLRNFCMFVIFYLMKKPINHINEADISIFHDLIKCHEKFNKTQRLRGIYSSCFADL